MATEPEIRWVCPSEGCEHAISSQERVQDWAMWCDDGHEIERLVPTVDRAGMEAIKQRLLDVRSALVLPATPAGAHLRLTEMAWLSRLLVEAEVVESEREA